MYWYRENDYHSALNDLKIADGLKPFNPRTYLGMAKVNLALGNYKEALENALEAKRLDLTMLETYLILGKAYMANDMLEEGLANLEFYGLYINEDPQYLALMGGMLFKIGEDYEEALSILERAKSLDSDLVEAYYYHGLISDQLGDYKQAVNDFYIARNLMPGNHEYAIWFGIALYKDGRYREAYNQFGSIEPEELNLEQAANYHYYKAKSGMELSLIESVEKAWSALLELPKDVVPTAWSLEAKDYLFPATDTPIPSSTSTAANITPAYHSTITSTNTPTSPTPTPTPTGAP
jgi:tetratricopeptide (TPR) repeat protein